MAEAENQRSTGRYWSLVFAAFAAAFIVGLAVAYLSVWAMGGQMGEIEGAGKYVSIIVSLACASIAYMVVLRQAFKYKPEK
jgi:Na+-driven multidrug efflux pump